MTNALFSIWLSLLGSVCATYLAAAEPQVINLWPGIPPSFTPSDKLEADTSGPDGRQVAGKNVVRLGHVQSPQLHLYVPEGLNTETIVLICPGGGYSILAWDLEGTEIAQWLNRIGVAAGVVKYRVPTRDNPAKWLAPVQDIQRAIELVRTQNVAGTAVKQIGVLGFSAGGNAAVRVATAKHAYYHLDGNVATAMIESSTNSVRDHVRADFGILVYPAWLVKEEDQSQLIEEIVVDKQSPPMFFAHAQNDNVSCLSSVTLFTELQKNDIPAALHVFADGGHGFGLRQVGLAHDAWPVLCEAWMRDRGWLAK
jgi:endo-1,4-beta-xylanase